MFAEKVRGVTENKSEENVWKLCLQPMLRWMSLIGLYSEKQHSDGIGHAIRRWTIYLSSVVISCGSLVSILAWEWETTPWVDLIEVATLIGYVVGINTGILFLTHPETWASLADSFQLHLPYALGISLKFRKLSLLAVFYIIVSNGIYFGLYLPMLVIDDGPPCTASFIFYILTIVTKVYPTTGVILFCLFLSLISTELRDIRFKLLNNPTSMTGKELKSLKRQHALICRSVEKINQLFGYIVLLEVVTIFIETVLNMIWFVPGVKDYPSLPLMVAYSIIYYMDQILHFVCITSLADRIPQENMKIYYTLTECEQLGDESLDDEIFKIRSSFETQVFRMNPQIEAAGIFTVSKRLLPSLIGTTLTYFFILVDFSNSSKKEMKNLNGNTTKSSL